MTETTKTSIFLALALVFVGLAALTRPVVPEIKMEEMVGKNLFPEFTSPLDVKKLEIIRFDAAGDREEFRIAEVDGIWSIPSHDNYPADAKDQMGKVAEALFDLTVVSVAAGLDEGVDATTLHSMYGVIDPDSEAASLGEGIGLRVSLAGGDDKKLVNLIVGKPVDTGDKKEPGFGDDGAKLRYVRIPGQSPVYAVKIDPGRFSTDFDQWIEKNLLDISTMDIKEIYVDEYSIRTELQMTQRGPQQKSMLDLIGDMTFGYDGSKTGAEKWQLEKWMEFKGQRRDRYEERKPAADQELNVEVLDGMVSALNDLKIVSVSKKPSALAAALREEKSFQDLVSDQGAPESLGKCGFLLVPLEDPRRLTSGRITRLLSNEGDIQLRMKDGIRYNLRFGDLTGTESEIKSEEGSETPTMGANRYLFITAEFDPAMVRPAEIQSVPEVPAEGDEIEKLKAEKDRIEKSNQREKDRFDREVEAGKKRAEKLTDRFADWYYVIPEDVYKKIHLTSANILRTKAAPAAHGEDGHVCDDDCEHADTPKKSEPELPGLPGTDGMFQVPGLDAAAPKPEPAEEPKKEEVKPAEEPKMEEVKPVEEPKKEEPKPAEEPKKEEAKKEDADKPFDPFGGKSPSE